MALMLTPESPEFGAKAPDFALPDTQGNLVHRDDVCLENGLLVMFICNHCPYVKAILPKIVRDAAELRRLQVGVVAIMSNDATDYPEDSPENMAILAREWHFPFPYLRDEDQSVAQSYGAVCTPDFFGYNGDLALCYRGRLDASGARDGEAEHDRELFEAMQFIARTGDVPLNQVPSMGCSIKWR